LLRRLEQQTDFGDSRYGVRLFLTDGGHLALVRPELSLARGKFRERLRQRDEGHRTPHAALDLAGRFRTREDPRQSVVILERDRIELMIVAAGAMQRHPQKRFAHLLNLVIDKVHPHGQLVGLDDIDVAQHQEARRRKLILPLFDAAGREQIASQLLTDKLVKRLIGVERTDHVVAITPRMFGRHVVR
jgi:hypothetical protein